MSKEVIKVRPLIKSSIYRAAEHVRDCLKEGDYLYLYHCKLSSFLDPNAVGQVLGKSMYGILYRKSIDLVVCKELQGKKVPLLAVDLGEDGCSEEKEKIMELVNIKYYAIPDGGFDNYADRISGYLSRMCDYDGRLNDGGLIRRRWTPSEYQVHRSLNRRLEKYNFIYLSEVSLVDAISVPDSERTRVQPRIREHNKKNKSWVSSDIYETLNFDGVVATKPPYSIPLFFVEVDGGVHNKPNARLKDQIKNGLIERTNFPLVRLDVENHQAKDEYIVDFVTFVARQLAQEVADSKQHLSILMDALEDEISELEDSDKSRDLGKLVMYLIGFYRSRLVEKSSSIDSLTEELNKSTDHIRHLEEKHIDSYEHYFEELEKEYFYVDEVESKIQETPMRLFDWSYRVVDNEGFKKVLLEGYIRSDVPSIGIQDKWVFESQDVKVRVYGTHHYKELISNALVAFERINLEKVAENRIAMYMHTTKDSAIDSLYKWQRMKELENIVNRYKKQKKSDKKLAIIKNCISNPRRVIQLKGENANESVKRHTDKINEHLAFALNVVESDRTLDDEDKEIMLVELNDYVQCGLENLKVVTRKEFLRGAEEMLSRYSYKDKNITTDS